MKTKFYLPGAVVLILIHSACAQPVIHQQPRNQTNVAGTTATFSVITSGLGPLSYQWRSYNAAGTAFDNILFAVNATYVLNNVQPTDRLFGVVVSDGSGLSVTSSLASLTVIVRPSITAQPMSLTVNEWQSASFTVTATGYPLSYQWRNDDVDLVGEMNPTYTLRLARTNQASSYTVVVSNPAGSVTSAPPAVLIVNPSAPGAVVAWGWWGPDSYTETDVIVAAQGGVSAIAAGGYHSVALKNNGSVLVWPDSGYGATAVPIEAQSGVTAIASGYGHIVALKNDGTVLAWGWNGGGQTAVPTAAQSGVTAIAAGWDHTVALKNGSVVAWGKNDQGQTTVPVAAQSGVTAIAAGHAHTVALKNDGSVVAWGYNWAGQTTVPIAAQSGVTAIAAGYAHTVALKTNGSVIEWGYGSGVPVAAQSGVIAIASGYEHNLALKNDSTVVKWGNDWGQTTVPEGLSGVTAIAAGLSHTVVLLGASPLLPFLNARPSGNQLILAWSTNAVGFTLQSTLDLVPPVTWVDVTNAPAVIGEQFTVTNSLSGPAQFYRLRKP